MSEAADQLRITREALVSMPSSEDEAYIAIRKSTFNRLIHNVKNLAEPSQWYHDLCLLCLGVCISAFFSLWLQSTSLSDVNIVKHWGLILGGGILSILCFIFDWTMKDVTVSGKQSIIDEMEKLYTA